MHSLKLTENKHGEADTITMHVRQITRYSLYQIYLSFRIPNDIHHFRIGVANIYLTNYNYCDAS